MSEDPQDCMLCTAERMTDWLHDDEDCWIAECVVCRTPMVVWRTHGLPDPAARSPTARTSGAGGRRALRRRGLLRRPRTAAHPRPLARARTPRRRLLRPQERPLRHVRRALRECSAKEPVELRHREGRESPLRRVEEALVDQPGPRFGDSLDRAAHLVGDRARALGLSTQLGHRPKVAQLRRRSPAPSVCRRSRRRVWPRRSPAPRQPRSDRSVTGRPDPRGTVRIPG